jgi:DNA modification methylase
VVDPFVGSGTTAIAAAELGRRCLGFDISEKYIRVAERRVAAAVLARQTSLDEAGNADATRALAAWTVG